MTTAALPGVLDPAVIEDPYPFYARLRREAPVWEVPGTGAHLVSSWALVADALERQEDFLGQGPADRPADRRPRS